MKNVVTTTLPVLAISLIAASGCSSVPYTIADDTQLQPVTMVDLRPEAEKEGGLPLFNDPTYTIPDDRFDPPLLDLLGDRLNDALGGALEGAQIEISRFRVQNYYGASYRNAQAASLAGAMIGAGDIGAAAYFSAARGGESIDVVLVEIAGTIAGDEFEARSAEPYDPKPPMTYMGMVYDLPEARAATRAAVESAIENAVRTIESKRKPQ